MIDCAQFDVLAEFHPKRCKRPLQARPVQQNIRSRIKRKSFIHISGSQPAGLRARLQHLNAESLPCKAQRRGKPAHPRANNHNILLHWVAASPGCCAFVRGKCKPRSRRNAPRTTRWKNETRCSGGKARSSISGTNNEPRPLPKTYTGYATKLSIVENSVSYGPRQPCRFSFVPTTSMRSRESPNQWQAARKIFVCSGSRTPMCRAATKSTDKASSPPYTLRGAGGRGQPITPTSPSEAWSYASSSAKSGGKPSSNIINAVSRCACRSTKRNSSHRPPIHSKLPMVR